MGLVSNTLLIISGVYLTLGLIYLRFWLDERSRRDYLAFAVCALPITLYAWCELGMMHSQTPDDYLFYAWWSFLIGNVVLIAIAWFAYANLNGRKWPFYAYCALRVCAVVIHLVLPNGINFREITEIGQVSFDSELFSYPIGVRSLWMIFPQVLHLCLVGYCLDASIRTWRLGMQRKAAVVGTGVVLFGLTVLAVGLNLFSAFIPIPVFVSFSIFFVIGPILYELNLDMHRAAMLSEKLEERETRLTETLEQLELTASAGDIGMWQRTTDGEFIWTSEKAGEIWGFPAGRSFKQEDLLQNIHPDDRDNVVEYFRGFEKRDGDHQLEYRIVRKDGTIRWIRSQGKADAVHGGIIRGAIVDLTEQKTSENAVRELSRKLIYVQEKERARVARELHDGLNQNIALLSIQLGSLQNQPKSLQNVTEQLGSIASGVEQLSRDVHRISHELHPVELTQLGLETALRSFCREFSIKHELDVDFMADHLQRDLSHDISLCIYRIAQEALDNVVEHSGATHVQVAVGAQNGEVGLAVMDNGQGFYLEEAKANGGLGLMSMYERVQHLGGRIDISSASGKGARIDVRIPLG